MPGAHSHKSPSKSERLHQCAGALSLEDRLPPEQKEESGEAAQRGTAAHGLLEKCLREGAEPKDFRDRIVELVGEDEGFSMLKQGARLPKGRDRKVFIVDDVMVDGVTMATDYVRRRMEEVGGAELTLEGRTNPCPDRDDTSGTADVTIDSWPDLLEVVDYKNGGMTVEHEDNPQLLSYLTGRAEETGWAHLEYMITVVQPNAYHEEGRIRSFTVTADELRAFQAKHRAAAERADEAENDYSELPFEEWGKKYLRVGPECDWCPARITCPAARKGTEDEAKIDFAKEPALPEIDGNMEHALQVMKWAPLVAAHAKAAERYIFNAVAAGQKVPGWKFVTKRRNRKLRDDLGTPTEIAAALVEDGYIGDNERARLFTEPELISGPQIEKLVPPKKRKEFAAKYLTKGEPVPDLSTEGDTREDYEPPNPADDFKGV